MAPRRLGAVGLVDVYGVSADVLAETAPNSDKGVASPWRGTVPGYTVYVNVDRGACALAPRVLQEAILYGVATAGGCSRRAHSVLDKVAPRMAAACDPEGLANVAVRAARYAESDPFVYLLVDHMASRTILNGLEAEVTPMLFREGIAKFIGGVHQRVEDEIVFPFLTKWARTHKAAELAEAVAHAAAEHTTITPLARRARAGDKGAIKAYVEKVRHHFKEEDFDIFTPAALNVRVQDQEALRAQLAVLVRSIGKERGRWLQRLAEAARLHRIVGPGVAPLLD